MGAESNVIMLNGGKHVAVALVSTANAHLLQALGGAASKTGVATLRVVRNAAGVPFVAVFIAHGQCDNSRSCERDNGRPGNDCYDGEGYNDYDGEAHNDYGRADNYHRTGCRRRGHYCLPHQDGKEVPQRRMSALGAQ